jgi:hypothetical protein
LNSVGEPIRIALEDELNAFNDRVQATADPQSSLNGVDDRSRVELQVALEEASSTLRSDADAARQLIDKRWELNGGCATWQENLAEEWRRLLVRIGIATVISASPELLETQGGSFALQEVVRSTAVSAAVGRWRLERFAQSVEAPSSHFD